jgi:hypothetical protein
VKIQSIIGSLVLVNLLGMSLVTSAEAAERVVRRNADSKAVVSKVAVSNKQVIAAASVEITDQQRSVAKALSDSPLHQQDHFARMVSDVKREGSLPLVNLTPNSPFRVSIGLNTHGKPCVCWYWSQKLDQ